MLLFALLGALLQLRANTPAFAPFVQFPPRIAVTAPTLSKPCTDLQDSARGF